LKTYLHLCLIGLLTVCKQSIIIDNNKQLPIIIVLVYLCDSRDAKAKEIKTCSHKKLYLLIMPSNTKFST